MNPKYDDLSTWDFWSLEEELGNILEAKGYGLINFDLTYDNQNRLAPCFEVETKMAGVLAREIRKHGFVVSVKQNINKPYISFVFVKNHYPVELLKIVETFEVIV